MLLFFAAATFRSASRRSAGGRCRGLLPFRSVSRFASRSGFGGGGLSIRQVVDRAVPVRAVGICTVCHIGIIPNPFQNGNRLFAFFADCGRKAVSAFILHLIVPCFKRLTSSYADSSYFYNFSDIFLHALLPPAPDAPIEGSRLGTFRIFL